ncbi:MAG: glycoside hydrolase/deacetylase [Paenibacillaceae bacterium]|jgi:hypothetical protein|nr:glycoside hydrolase/deacetylase [Paenibacillaceae bacterium]
MAALGIALLAVWFNGSELHALSKEIGWQRKPSLAAVSLNASATPAPSAVSGTRSADDGGSQAAGEHSNTTAMAEGNSSINTSISTSITTADDVPPGSAGITTDQLPMRSTDELVPYKGPIEHIFFHPLILYPQLAFDGDQMAQGFDDWFVTVPEFKRIIDELYKRDYILVDIRTLYREEETADGKAMEITSLQLPAGKKPLVLSVDDLNYYDYMIKNGTASKLVLDQQGNIATQSVTPEGQTIVERDNEIVPIVDAFVEEHPDFSFQGAKGVLAVTGYEGVLGYRTQKLEDPEYPMEKEAAVRVVERLKETGWSFASHSWGHPNAETAGLQRMLQDTERWAREVEPIVGETPVFIYPYGARLKHTDPKFKLLTDAGFKLFCGVGPAPYLRSDGAVAEMDRRHIDGIALRTQQARLAPLFDAEAIFDHNRPPAN